MMTFDSTLKEIFIEGLLKSKEWYQSENSAYLISIFDQVGFKDKEGDKTPYFVLPASLSPKIEYPVQGKSEKLKEVKKVVLSEIRDIYDDFSEEYLSLLSVNQLYFLLEKFGGNIPIGDPGKVSIFECYKIKAARAVVEWNCKHEGHMSNLLINIDISGIQRFIYNIASEGALKNLRSRSFYIEILCKHITKRVLDVFHLHYANVLMDGGGSIYILSACPGNYEKLLTDISDALNSWLLKEFNGRLYAAFSVVACSDEELEKELMSVVKELTKKAFEAKQRKFYSLIEKGTFIFEKKEDPKYYQCVVCGKDDTHCEYINVPEKDGGYRCSLCDRLIKLGNEIPETRFIYIGDKGSENSLWIEDVHYVLSKDSLGKDCIWVIYEDREDLIKDIGATAFPLFAKTYLRLNRDLPEKAQKEVNRKRQLLEQALLTSEGELKQYIEKELGSLNPNSTTDLDFLSLCSEGSQLVAALRMDADNMGKIFQSGFYGKVTLEGLSSFSRNTNNFFRLYINTICQQGLGRKKEHVYALKYENGRNVHIVYAGGDDLFILGAWSDTAEMAMDIGEAFCHYTCDNIDIGLSGGLTVHHSKFPVNKMADTALSALSFAKENRQSCWMCRKEWIDCPLYDTGKCFRKDSLSIFFTEHMVAKKQSIDKRLSHPKYVQETPRMKLALKWKRYDPSEKRLINEIDEYITKPLLSFKAGRKILPKGFFHTALSLLEIWYIDERLYLPKIVWLMEKFRDKLKKIKIQPFSENLYDLYDMNLHLYDTQRFSTLYIPLSWNILAMKGGAEDDEE
jgi:CRISPR-associated protein Csm1